ncbi:uncharacterized protein LOC26528257 [Drosophila mojavensis]|uniref:DUF753 domain-containing protein n=1 Tax=Drosophila mojavensis TaxID=7230 RepID=A0A0Q9XGB4_DROMO|nr:uncharacterized protein LOC26528257 [Drosophila mojavensis]KRG03986.1 uncharacterized protein Dmoj_GI26616 [Drosophila mojavensis]
MEKFKILIIYLGFSFSIPYLTSCVNGQNICLTCENLESCTVNETFVSNHEDDDNKIVLRGPQDESDPKIDNCMIPNYTIKGQLTDLVCSTSHDNKCHAIRPENKKAPTSQLCAECGFICGCTGNLLESLGVGKGVVVNFILILSCLLAFFILTI